MNDKKELKLILVAARNQLSSNDIKSLIAYLESDDCEFEISLQISEPTEQPELLELHRLVAIPAPVSYTHLRAHETCTNLCRKIQKSFRVHLLA